VWLGAWFAGAGIGVANGVARETTYGTVLDERRAHQVSSLTALVAFAALFRALERRWPLASDADAVGIGAAWLAMTVAFELGFGRLVAHQSWGELLADYDLARGRLWPVVLGGLAVGPLVARRTDDRLRTVT
jgi:hypothetical protein